MYCLSSSTAPDPATSLANVTKRPGKFHDAPPLPVERNTTKPLDASGLLLGGAPRMNTWHERYALPRVSHATDVSPEACQYWRGGPHPPPAPRPWGPAASA